MKIQTCKRTSGQEGDSERRLLGEGWAGSERLCASSTSSRGGLLTLLMVGTWILLTGEVCTPDLNKGKEAH